MALDLTGTWQGVYAEVNGEGKPASYARGLESNYDGSNFSIRVQGEVAHEGTYSIDEGSDPAQITFVYTTSSHFPLQTPRTGILQVVGDTYKNCIGAVGAPVPSAFNTTPQSGTALTILRKKEAQESSPEEPFSPQIYVPRTPLW